MALRRSAVAAEVPRTPENISITANNPTGPTAGWSIQTASHPLHRPLWSLLPFENVNGWEDVFHLHRSVAEKALIFPCLIPICSFLGVPFYMKGIHRPFLSTYINWLRSGTILGGYTILWQPWLTWWGKEGVSLCLSFRGLCWVRSSHSIISSDTHKIGTQEEMGKTNERNGYCVGLLPTIWALLKKSQDFGGT